MATDRPPNRHGRESERNNHYRQTSLTLSTDKKNRNANRFPIGPGVRVSFNDLDSAIGCVVLVCVLVTNRHHMGWCMQANNTQPFRQ